MNANDVMKELSKKHTRPPVAALKAALELRSEVASLMLDELKRLLATFNSNLNAPTETEFKAKMKQAVKKPSALFSASSWRPNGSRGGLPAVRRTPELARGDAPEFAL